MKSDVLQKLEFNKVVERISKFALTEIGKNNILKSLPSSSLDWIVREGILVNQCKSLLNDNEVPPIEAIPNLSEELALSKIDGAALSTKKIQSILHLLILGRTLQNYLKNRCAVYPDLYGYKESIYSDKQLENEILKIIGEDGIVKDSASPKLSSIRKEIKDKNDELRKVVNRLTRDLISKEILREEYSTLREGRVVLPIKVEHKRQIRGFIHSESSSGQTIYIEPEETLALNNELVSLSFAEKREIERILRNLTKDIGEVSDFIQTSLEVIGYIDSLFAKASYSIEVNGTFPSFEEKKSFNLVNGFHPILLEKIGKTKTIPLSLKIDDDRILIITGPNAGGKTVVLKTFGLLISLVHAGFHIPCSGDSNFHFIENILIDIGDQQSIEDDLSTFSSHLSNLKSILEMSNSKSLILLDEIGTGTDPGAGAALASSILINLSKRNPIVLATTHLGNLKILAHEQHGFQNASMEFDTEGLVPTYRFNQGVPGSSYAFEIAKRLGFSEEIISTANQFLSEDENKLESILFQLEKQNQLMKEKLKRSEVEVSRYEGLSLLYQKKVTEIDSEKRKILKSIKQEALEKISKLQREIEFIIKEIKENQASKESIKHAKNIIKSAINDTQNISDNDIDLNDKNFNFVEGNFVRVKDTATVGKIIEINHSKQTAVILSGILKMQVELSNLIPAKNEKDETKFSVYHTKIAQPEIRIDIRGKRSEEVEFELIRFLDDAYSNSLSSVEILHGKGTGALKKTVKLLLDQHEKVKNYRFAPVEFGGEGITIVELK